MSRLTFAYGSNMWQAQMRRRCPQSHLLGPAQLHGYRWIITTRGYANIVAHAQGVVMGMLYAISPSDEAALDDFEGVAQGNYRKEMVEVQQGGEVFSALVYVDPIQVEGVPQLEYIARINAALNDAQLPDDYVATVIRPFIPETPQV